MQICHAQNVNKVLISRSNLPEPFLILHNTCFDIFHPPKICKRIGVTAAHGGDREFYVDSAGPGPRGRTDGRTEGGRTQGRTDGWTNGRDGRTEWRTGRRGGPAEGADSRKGWTIQNARQCNDFHGFLMKKHDSTTNFIDFYWFWMPVQRFSSTSDEKQRQYKDLILYHSTTIFIDVQLKSTIV